MSDEPVLWLAVRIFGVLVDLVYLAAVAICEGPKLIKHGPRYWRVERKLRHRAWKRRLQ